MRKEERNQLTGEQRDDRLSIAVGTTAISLAVPGLVAGVVIGEASAKKSYNDSIDQQQQEINSLVDLREKEGSNIELVEIETSTVSPWESVQTRTIISTDLNAEIAFKSHALQITKEQGLLLHPQDIMPYCTVGLIPALAFIFCDKFIKTKGVCATTRLFENMEDCFYKIKDRLIGRSKEACKPRVS
jgi:hypothetical protein